MFFLFLAIHEAFNKARPLLIGLLVGASFWCRLTTILGIFFFAGLIVSRAQGQNWSAKLRASFPSLFMLFLGAGVFVVLDMVYNFVRFGIPFDAGYWMIPGVLDEPWHSQGLFNLAYIPDNLRVFFFGLPVFVASAPYAYVPLTGLAIWFTTPAFIYTLRAKVKDSVTWSAWLAIFAIGAVVFTRALSGWGFGYRYAMDFYPFLYVLTVRGMGEKVRWHHILLLVIAILVNLWGTLAINQFNLTDVNMPR